MGRIFPFDYVQKVLNAGEIGEDVKQLLLDDNLKFIKAYESEIMSNLLIEIKKLKQIDDKAYTVVLKTRLGQICELWLILDELYKECWECSSNQEPMTKGLADRILNAVNHGVINSDLSWNFETLLFSETTYTSFSCSMSDVPGEITYWGHLMSCIIDYKRSLIEDAMGNLTVRLRELKCALVQADLKKYMEMIKKLQQYYLLLSLGEKYMSSQSEKEDPDSTIKF